MPSSPSSASCGTISFGKRSSSSHFCACGRTSDAREVAHGLAEELVVLGQGEVHDPRHLGVRAAAHVNGHRTLMHAACRPARRACSGSASGNDRPCRTGASSTCRSSCVMQTPAAQSAARSHGPPTSLGGFCFVPLARRRAGARRRRASPSRSSPATLANASSISQRTYRPACRCCARPALRSSARRATRRRRPRRCSRRARARPSRPGTWPRRP